MNPDSPSDIRSLLEERGLALKKRWGQNFLVNRAARERLLALLEPAPGDTVWEIGPGLGAMTAALLSSAGAVIAFEVDRGMCRYLEETLGGAPAFTLVPGDFLQTWAAILSTRGLPARILGNLPYRSASLMIAALIEAGVRPARMVFTVQKELADRMASAPGRKSYSSFSVLCQACFRVWGRGDLQPGNFYPAPDVVSSVVEMSPLPGAPGGATLLELSRLTRELFASRRKTIRNNVRDAAVAMALEAEGIDLGERAEQVPPEAFVRLARRVAQE
ncbi:MAG TPA: 16S rRNA (adenine(1518)-N(6)/adenine(1519)-N(6))-dimethyltransferase RsmA [Spirochaetia bacterium]|nr:16S rRNA (adenine(1518)-N(6)/adenine(1519)-N(6))-dimethyltransferase RsmA [Spirochaetia bacterium]